MKRTGSYLYFLFCKFFFKYYCPIQILGRENLPTTSCILCSNHTSHMDTPVLMIATGIAFDQLAIVAAKDYFMDNFWRKKVTSVLMNLIPIDRKITSTSLSNSISACKGFIENKGRYLIIYPEGTRSTTGEMKLFKRGPALIAEKLNIPLVPVYINGTYESMAKGQIFPKAKVIQVQIGKPIVTSHQNKNHVTDLLESSIRKLNEGYSL